MHNNFYFLRQLSPVLDHRLRGLPVVSCFSQEKEELVLEFGHSTGSFFIRANLSSSFCCLSFPENFIRARKNTVDLFPSLLSRKVKSLRQYDNERSFSIELDDDCQVLFNMHGHRANIILFERGLPMGIFKNERKADWNLRLEQLDRPMDWSEEFFDAHQSDLPKAYFTFGSTVWAYLAKAGFNEMEVKARWTLFQQTLRLLQSPTYFICENEGQHLLSLVPLGKTLLTFSGPIEAIDEFYHAAIHSRTLSSERNVALQQLHARLNSGGRYLEKNREKLKELVHHSPYQIWADLIMANMGRITTGAEKIVLENLYDNLRPVEVKLKKNLNAQKNAEVYYRKAKNQQIEIRKLKESITLKEQEMVSISQQVAALEKETALKSLRKQIEATGLATGSKEPRVAALPYHEHDYNGFKIRVGKNAAGNDQLTLNYSYKEDLWLHAKDVAGSHVLIKHQAGKNFPKDVIEHAAQLAAHHSKRKNESLCPVIVTPKKFVRKRKGDPAGVVVVEREDVVMVSPLGP